ncbi:MAG TPA: transglycosylase family protein [Mycobacteriales bacterium]|nr:transglycosylase family protein [Mycobacteriales bacterium]
MLRPRRTARHAKPSELSSKVAPVVAVGGLTAGLVAVDGAVLAGTAAADAAPSVENFDRLAQCESGGRWGIATGNGYYGGLQFAAATWRSLGYSGLPHQFSREVQIEAGQKLQARSGWGQWPACSRKLGLRGGGGAAVPAAQPAAKPVAKKASRQRTAPVSSAQVPFGGDVTTAQVGQVREDVRAWQARMRQRGWKISVDGRFGRQSASVAQRFAAQKGLATAPGALNAAVYGAAWSLPVT